MPAPSLDVALSGRNALGAVRLALAALVVVGHSWPLGGYAPSPLERMADVAVNGFFALSGYLITTSRMRSDIGRYLRRRAQRIFPAFWVSLAVVAFVFAPLGALLNGRGWDPGESLSFVTSNALLMMNQWHVGATLSGAPQPGTWNGSLWTLMYEFAAYLACGALLGIGWARRHLLLTSGALVVALPALAWVLGDLAGSGRVITNGLRLGGFFAAGMLAYALRRRLRPSTPVATACAGAVLLLATAGEGVLHLLGPLPLAYLLLHVGATWRTTLGAHADHSYGLYVYAWPVQQLLGMLGLGALLPVWGFGVASLLLTLPLAALSWHLVEKPAMRWRPSARPAPVDPFVPRPAPERQPDPHLVLVATR